MERISGKKQINLFILILLFNFLIAQDNSVLKTIDVYGSQIDLSLSESGKNITIITKNQISDYTFNSIDELLKLIPSIELQSRGGFGNQSDLVLRGSTFTQTLVLLDGARVNDPLTGHFSMYIPITPYEIEQIEIIRGGGSSLFGPDAVGGVINIVTKAFTNKENNDEFVYKGKVGSNKLRSNNIFFSRNLNSRYYTSFGLNLIKSDGQELYKDVFSFFDNQTFSLSHKYLFNEKLSLSLRSVYAKRFFNSQYYYTRSSYDMSNETIKKNWTQALVDYKVDSVSDLKLMATYQSVDDLYIFNPAFPSYQNFTQLSNINLTYFKQQKSYSSVAGINIENRKISSLDRGNHSDYYIGSFVNLKKKVKNITLNPSARLDYNESYGFQLCPQFDISFENNDFNLRSSLGRTIRSADFTERFYNYNYSDTLSIGRNIGNPDLEAEKSLNFEIGVDIKRYKNLLFKNTVFIRRSTNLIDWVLTNSDEIISNVNTYENSDYLYAQNISNLNTLGYEGEFWFKFLNQENLNLDGSLGYTKIFNSEPGQNIFQNNINISSKYLANSSGDRFSYNIIAKNKKLKLNLNGQLKVREKENDISINQNLGKAYFVQNLNLGYLHNEFISLDFEIINLFNTNYSDLLGAIMPKRWLIVGLEVKI